MAEETLPILEKTGGVVAEDSVSGVAIKQIETGKHTIYLATTGIGEIRAATAVQMLVDLFDVEAVLNFGFVGSLNRSIPVGELVLVERAVHYQFDISAVDGLPAGCYDGKKEPYFYLDKTLLGKVQAALPRPMRTVTAASGDVFVADNKLKTMLRDTFFGDICEMEIAGICLAAERNNVPVFSMKVVSDGADENAKMSFGEVLEKGLSKYENLLPVVLDALSDDEIYSDDGGVRQDATAYAEELELKARNAFDACAAVEKHVGILMKIMPERTVANVMKLHLCHYAKNTPHAKAVRLAVAAIKSVDDIFAVSHEYLLNSK